MKLCAKRITSSVVRGVRLLAVWCFQFIRDPEQIFSVHPIVYEEEQCSFIQTQDMHVESVDRACDMYLKGALVQRVHTGLTRHNVSQFDGTPCRTATFGACRATW